MIYSVVGHPSYSSLVRITKKWNARTTNALGIFLLVKATLRACSTSHSLSLISKAKPVKGNQTGCEFNKSSITSSMLIYCFSDFSRKVEEKSDPNSISKSKLKVF